MNLLGMLRDCMCNKESLLLLFMYVVMFINCCIYYVMITWRTIMSNLASWNEITKGNTEDHNQPRRTTMNAVKHIQEVSEESLHLKMAMKLFSEGFTQIESLVLSTTLIENIPLFSRGWDAYAKQVDKLIYNTELVYDTTHLTNIEIDWKSKILDMGLLEVVPNIDILQKGELWNQLLEGTEKNYPKLASVGMSPENRHKKDVGIASKLLKDARRALEKVEYNIDEYMLEVAEKVYSNPQVVCDELYVLQGARHMVDQGNPVTVSEFGWDTRGRLYQLSCHGGNSQSSDMARSLYDLTGISRDYDPVKALEVIMHEISDMWSGDNKKIGKFMSQYTSANEFIIDQLELKEGAIVKKPWSFLKAYRIAKAITMAVANGTQLPYIGMAFGLDAKCSGPQNGAIMCNDEVIAKACGLSLEEVDDAYKMATDALVKVGFDEIPRSTIKKPYMGIFYGQSYMAFCMPSEKELEDLKLRNLINILKSGPEETLEGNAKLFHSTIEGSFGKMSFLRENIRAAHYHYIGEDRVYHTKQGTRYVMSDGFIVDMGYKVQLDIEGNIASSFIDSPDVLIKSSMKEYTFKKIKFTTKRDHLGDHARTGFVNLLQGVDALLARLIITNLKNKEKVNSIIGVHDCFRVDIHSMIAGKLHNAIKDAYLELFGSKQDTKTGYLRQGVDIVKMYFEGVNNARLEPGRVYSQFDKQGDRHLQKIDNVEVVDLIKDLKNDLNRTGNTYYFAK